MEVGTFGVLADVYESQMKRILEVYMKDGNIAVIPTDEAKIAEILSVCRSYLGMVSFIYNKDILQVVERFSEVMKRSYTNKSNINWDDVIV